MRDFFRPLHHLCHSHRHAASIFLLRHLRTLYTVHWLVANLLSICPHPYLQPLQQNFPLLMGSLVASTLSWRLGCTPNFLCHFSSVDLLCLHHPSDMAHYHTFGFRFCLLGVEILVFRSPFVLTASLAFLLQSLPPFPPSTNEAIQVLPLRRSESWRCISNHKQFFTGAEDGTI